MLKSARAGFSENPSLTKEGQDASLTTFAQGPFQNPSLTQGPFQNVGIGSERSQSKAMSERKKKGKKRSADVVDEAEVTQDCFFLPVDHTTSMVAVRAVCVHGRQGGSQRRAARVHSPM